MTTCPTHVLLQRLFRAADAFPRRAQHDDMTIVVLRR